MEGTGLPTEFASSRCQSKNRKHSDAYWVKIRDLVDKGFSKKFRFSCSYDWQMPKPETLFKQERFIVKELQEFKFELNTIKNNLNDLPLNEWHIHTGFMNHAGNIFPNIKKLYQPELFTQAWCKFYEILCSYKVLSKMCIVSRTFNSVHLCEAPGAFVASLNHFLQLNYPEIKWKWRCNTLNPYYEGNSSDQMISDDRLIMNTFENWSFGEDWTGNLFEMKNVEELVKDAAKMGPVNLVTADGSVNCQNDPGEQENIVSSLHYCETIAALNLLTQGGSFVLKVFTMFESETVCLMYMLCCFFEKVNVFKPVTSKEGNSESYVVCLGFVGRESISDWLGILNEHYGSNVTASSLFRLKDIHPTFLNEIIHCSDFFKKQQIDILNRNLKTFERLNSAEEEEIMDVKKTVADEFKKRYRMETIPRKSFIVPHQNKQWFHFNFSKKEEGSFTERQYYAAISSSELKNNEIYLRHLKESILSLKEIIYYDEILHFDSQKVSLQHIEKEPFNEDILYFKKGKRVKELSNSRFCMSKLIDIRKKLQELVTDATNLLPTTTVGSYYVNFEDKDMLIDTCELSDDIWQKEPHENHLCVLSGIKESIHGLKHGESLYLTGYQLLTLFSVGLLYLLGLSFQYVVFFNPNVHGNQLLLYKYDQNFKYKQNSNIEVVLGDIINMMKECSADQSVLTLVRLRTLCTGEFYKWVTACNHIILEVSSLNILNENLKQSPTE